MNYRMLNKLLGILLAIGLVFAYAQPAQAYTASSAKAGQVRSLSKITEYEYDNDNGEWKLYSECNITYNSKGYIKKVEEHSYSTGYAAEGELVKTDRYYYSSKGRLTKITSKSKNAKTSSGSTYRYTYDSKGRLKTASDSYDGNTSKTKYIRNKKGRLTEHTLHQGKKQIYDAKYTYKNGRVSKIDRKSYSEGTDVITYKYTRIKGKQKIKSITREQLTDAYYADKGDMEKWTYSYYSSGKIKKLQYKKYNKNDSKSGRTETETYNKKGIVTKHIYKVIGEKGDVTVFKNGLPVRQGQNTWKYTRKNGKVVRSVHYIEGEPYHKVEAEYTMKKSVPVSKDIRDQLNDIIDKNGGYTYDIPGNTDKIDSPYLSMIE